MAITFTEVFRSNVLDSLTTLLNSEFNKLPIFFDKDFKPRGSFFFRIIPNSESLEEPTITDQLRNYNVLVKLYRKTPGSVTKKNNYTQLVNYVDRIKRLIANNSNYRPSSVYKWHDGRISSVNYQPDLEDSEVGYQVTDITFECAVLA